MSRCCCDACSGTSKKIISDTGWPSGASNWIGASTLMNAAIDSFSPLMRPCGILWIRAFRARTGCRTLLNAPRPGCFRTAIQLARKRVSCSRPANLSVRWTPARCGKLGSWERVLAERHHGRGFRRARSSGKKRDQLPFLLARERCSCVSGRWKGADITPRIACEKPAIGKQNCGGSYCDCWPAC